MRVRKVCAKCGSDDIVCPSLAVWGMDQQEWVFDLPFDPEYCRECDSFDIADEEIKDEEDCDA